MRGSVSVRQDEGVSSPLTPHKQGAWLRIGAGAVLLGVGAMRPGPLGVLLVIGGTWLILTHWQQLQHLARIEKQLYRNTGEDLRRQLRRASLPRQIFWILFAVAEVDGNAGDAERELVRRFLLERMPDPLTQQELAEFEASRIAPEQVEALVLGLRTVLTPAECDTVFHWCCRVALADQRFVADEHVLLQTISRAFGIERLRARAIFQRAKDETLGLKPQPARGTRNEALAVLGLPDDATPEQIRKRHRELVKRYHPDAHARLGPAAMEEASQRFREIHAAYETLT